MPSRLFINHVDTGANAGQMFLQKVDTVSAEIRQPADSPSPMVCSQPEYRDFSPEAAQVSLVDFTGRSAPAELVWTIRMENGDTIRLRQKIAVEQIRTYDYGPENYPMSTMEDLQALVDRISQEIPLPAVVNLHLPAVTYTGSLTIDGRPINLYGSVDAMGNRTTFTDTVRVGPKEGPITYFYDLDFAGGGTGVGVSASARFWAENCQLIYEHPQNEDLWSAHPCNSSGSYVTHSLFNDNTFVENDTAVLLEEVPSDEPLNFQGCRFTDNGVDIDNRCGQPVEISQAIFE